MRIDDKMIAEKKIVGKTAGGDPVVMILTHGGLYAFFSKNDNGIETLGLAPHKAIAAWLAEKKAGSIKWKDDFLKNEAVEYQELKKNNDHLFMRLRKLIFSAGMLKKSFDDYGYYLVYDTSEFNIAIMHKDEIKEGIKDGSIDRHFLVRNINLTETAQLVEDHKEFK